MQTVYLDFETFYDTHYTLTKMSTAQYINHEDFHVWGVGIKFEDEDTEWYGATEATDILEQIDWSNTALVCHNTLFDAFILTRHYGLTPKYYYDTAAMSRGLYPNMSARLKDCVVREFPSDESMRKGEELVNAKGIRDLSPELDEQIGSYCIQDVDLTHALFQAYKENFPCSELDLIDLTVRMYVEPKLLLDRPMLLAYKEECEVRALASIDASGVTREVLASCLLYTSPSPRD